MPAKHYCDICDALTDEDRSWSDYNVRVEFSYPLTIREKKGAPPYIKAHERNINLYLCAQCFARVKGPIESLLQKRETP